MTSQPHRNAAELDAYNRAFWQLGLPWAWDEGTFEALSAIACPTARLERYLQTHRPHLLKAYDAKALAEAIEAQRADAQRAEVQRAEAQPHPMSRAAGTGGARAVQSCNWAAACLAPVGA